MAMKDSKSSNLVWIDSYTSNEPSDWSKQRRNVMQKVALRRKRGPKQRHPNSRQLPVFIYDKDINLGSPLLDKNCSIESENQDSAAVEFDDSYLQTGLTHLRIAAAHPSMLVRCNLDFTDLSSLASLEVGRYTGQRLIERPQSIAHFLGGTTWSYCRYVPLYYSQSVLIRSATDCVIARTRSLLTPDDTVWQSVALKSYSKALSMLQESINSTLQRPTAEILCATQVLSLYELLNPLRENAWIEHAAGAASIIRLRGPNSYKSDFEKSLFMSHVGPMITEAILENQSCFLEQPAWIAVLRSIITDKPLIPERSTTLISLITLLISIPGLFKDITTAICHRPDPPVSTLIELMFRARNLRVALKSWYSTHIGLEDTPVIENCRGDGYYKLLVLFYLMSIYSNRLHTCIHWIGTPDIELMEEESQRFAKIIVSFCKNEGHSNLQSSLILAQKLPIAEATIESNEEWKQQWRHNYKQGQLFKMPERTFKHWCSLFGRKTS